MANNNSFIQSAATNGLLLSLITILYTLLGSIIPNNVAIGMVLQIAKIAVVIYLMYYFMKNESVRHNYVSYSRTFQYGLLVALFSTIAITAFNVLYYYVINPDIIATMEETALGMLESMGTYESMDFAKIMKYAVFIGYPVYYMIWGLIISSIAANFTKQGDIFSANEVSDDDDI